MSETVIETGWDENIESHIVKRVGPWIVSVTPMIFNSRILLTHVSQYPLTWTSGFCYDKGPSAALAAMAWDPLTEPRPVGFKKVAAEDLHIWRAANSEWNESIPT
jgi:hypothetical protein